jgi:flagellar hook-basal body complex protein FliE
MANMGVENLQRIVQGGGDTEELFSSNAASEFRATQEMTNQGMKVPQAGESSGTTFSEILKDSVDKVNTMQAQADESISNLVAGRTKNIHETMLAIERADSSLKLMMQVRNKILDAYKEIMHMQV